MRPKKIVTEVDVKKKIIEPWLARLDAWFFMQVPTGYGKAGVPDYVACVPMTITPEMVGQRIGLFVAPEAKRPSKKSNVSPSQLKQIDEIDQAGGITGVISNQADCDHMHYHIYQITLGHQ